uniref:Uncharacterized protein n=1 Tax=Aegilops tauschii TaxID=37682 RepID=R7W0C4_AEGTA
MAFYLDHYVYVRNSMESVQDMISCFGMSFAQEHNSYQNNYSHGWSENLNMSYRSNNPEISSFASSYPMQGFRTHLSLEFTWSAKDDPIRKVILEKMKKIKSGKELVEEEQDDPELEFPSDEDEDKRSTTLEEVKEVVVEDEELEIQLPIIIQECDIAGLSNPLDDMRPYNLFATTLHYMIPSLKIDLKAHLLGYDDTYTVGGIALIYDDDIYSPHARPMLNDKYHPHVSIELADSYHTRHVLYSYAYVIGYSIDDLRGLRPYHL